MTVQVRSVKFAKSKRILQDALNEFPSLIWFEDPSIFNPRVFTGNDMKPGEQMAVVMDPPKRNRFALVTRDAVTNKFEVT